MAQIKIYGRKQHLDSHKQALSAAIHTCSVEVLRLPADKRFHRFIALEAADFIYPADRSPNYTIIEVSMFAGRSEVTKKTYIRALFERLEPLGISPYNLEITLFETAPQNWGIRGKVGDELTLGYEVEV